MNLICPEPIYVDSDDKLKLAASQWQQSPVLAIDTEFMRTNTFYPYLGLIQLSDGKQCWLVDPLAEMDLSAVKDLLINPNVVKIFHSCSEDLEVLNLAFEVQPKPLIDTQIAAAIAGTGFGLGYNNLLNQMLEISLDKHQTRSDWLQRPLSQQQLMYAAEDVYYLFHLFPLIEAQLETQGRKSWLEQDMTRLLEVAAQPSDPAKYYLRIKSAWRLPQPQLGLLQQLCQWRENEAMLRNKPRGHIIKDDQLVNIVKHNPLTKDALANAGSLHGGTLRRYGQTLLDIISGHNKDPQSFPQPLPQPLGRGLNKLVKQVKATIENIAQQHQIPKEILAAKRDVEQLVKHGLKLEASLPEKFSNGWRGKLLLKDINAVITQYTQQQDSNEEDFPNL